MSLIKSFSNLFRTYSAIEQCKSTLPLFPRIHRTFSIDVQSSQELYPKPDTITDDLDYSLYKHLTNTNDEEKELKMILLEILNNREIGERVPKQVNEAIIKHLLGIPTPYKRLRYLCYCYMNEYFKEKDMLKKIKKRAEREALQKEREAQGPPKHILYGLNFNTIFFQIRKTKMGMFYNHKLMTAMQFGVPLVMDMGLHSHMVAREYQHTCDQLQYVYGINRSAKDPFNIILCNCPKDNPLIPTLQKSIGNLDADENMMNLEERSYLDIFPKNKLVYLSPNAKETMLKYDPDKVYIIGGLVDKLSPKPYTLAKAKEEGLKVMKLPLDHYLKWGANSGKILTLNQMVNIMLELKESGDFNKAFVHIPLRKLMSAEEIQAKSMMEQKKKFKKNSKKEHNGKSKAI